MALITAKRVTPELLKCRAGEIEPRPFEFVTEPYHHQRVMVEYLRTLEHVAIFAEQGTGKTKVVLDYLDLRVDEKIRRRDPAALARANYLAMISGSEASRVEALRVDGQFVVIHERILVICPNTVCGTWVNETTTHSFYYHKADGRIFNLAGASKKKRIDTISEGRAGIYIINFEGVRAMKAADYNLANFPWDVVVVDEMSMIKHRQSQQSKAIHEIAKYCKAKRIGMTGTPITQGPLDLFSQFLFVDPDVLGRSWYEFAHEYSVQRERCINGQRFQEVIGYRNLQDLHDRAYSAGVRFTKDECILDPPLPEKVYQVRTVPMPKELGKVYKSMATELVAEVNADVSISAINVLAKLGKLRQLSSGFLYLPEDPDEKAPVRPARRFYKERSPKAAALCDLLDEIDGKAVIFVCFHEDRLHLLDVLMRYVGKRFPEDFEKPGGGVETMSGNDSAEERTEMIRCFQEGGLRYLVAMTTVTRFGITLTASQTAIYYSQDFNLDTRMQSEDRIHRIGQTGKATLIDLVLEGTVDKSVTGSLRAKKNMARMVLTGEGLAKFAAGELDMGEEDVS